MKNLDKEKNSEHGFSSSNPPKSSASPRPSSTGENNENDSSQDQMIPKLHRNTPTKHFMSPTISASSKAAVPRKKILGERNDNSSSSDINIHNSDLKKGSRGSGNGHSKRSSSRAVSLSNCASDSDDDGADNISLFEGSSAKKYDPLTNYLSPRPKYLRFNPNRRREIFNRLEKEGLNSSFDSVKVDDDGAESSSEGVKDSHFTPLKEIEGKQENIEKEDVDMDDSEDEGEEEEVEEGRGYRCFRGLLKVLLTLIACVLSTSYMCSMNSPMPLQSQKVIWGLNDSYFLIQKEEIGGVTVKMHDNGAFPVGGVHIYDGIDEKETFEADEETDEVEAELEMIENAEAKVFNEELTVNEDNGGKTNEAAEIEGIGSDEVEFQEERHEEFIGVETNERENSTEEDEPGLAEEDEFSNHGGVEDKIEAGETEISGNGVEPKTESFEHPFEPENESFEHPFEPETESFEHLMAEKIDDAVYPTGSQVENEVEDSNQFQVSEPSLKSEVVREEMPQFSEAFDGTESPEELINEVDEKGNDNEGEVEKSGKKSSLVIGVSVFILLVALAFVYDSKKARNVSSRRAKPAVKPSKFETEDKVTQELPPVEKKIEFLAKPSSLHLPTEEAHKEFNLSVRAPTVELIGEIVVGGVGSSRRKYQMNEHEESHSGNYFKQDPVTLPNPAPYPVQSPEVVFPTTYSSNHGNFTSARKASKKEGGKRGEATIEVTPTPVRRSSRLRSRAGAVS